MSILSVPNAELFTQSEGTGEPLLLIAGMASDVASWTPLKPCLGDAYQLISFDNRGAGRTTLQKDDFSIDDMVDDAIAVLDHYKIEKAQLVGHSLGGLIGLRMLKIQPERVGAFVTLAAATVPSIQSITYFEEMTKLYKSDMPRTDWFKLLLPTLFSPGFFASEEALNATAASAAAYTYCQSPQNLQRQVQMFKTIKPLNLDTITTPILSVTGELDLAFPPDVVKSALSNLPHATFITLDNIAHSIHWENPQAVGQLIVDFFDSHPL